MTTLDLQPRHWKMLLANLAAFTPDAEVWAFGSRVIGRSHEGSDLDLVIRNPEDLKQPLKNMLGLREALRESDLPFFVEVLDWAQIPESFRKEIQQQHVVLISPKERSLKTS